MMGNYPRSVLFWSLNLENFISHWEHDSSSESISWLAGACYVFFLIF